jgi:hypothetical protein
MCSQVMKMKVNKDLTPRKHYTVVGVTLASLQNWGGRLKAPPLIIIIPRLPYSLTLTL